MPSSTFTDTWVFAGKPLRVKEITPCSVTEEETVEEVPGVEAFAPPGGRAEAVPIPRPRAREAAAQAVRALRVKDAFEEAAEKGARMVVLSHFPGRPTVPLPGAPLVLARLRRVHSRKRRRRSGEPFRERSRALGGGVICSCVGWSAPGPESPGRPRRAADYSRC